MYGIKPRTFTLSCIPSPFLSFIFRDGLANHPGWTWICNPPPSASQSTGITGVCRHTNFNKRVEKWPQHAFFSNLAEVLERNNCIKSQKTPQKNYLNTLSLVVTKDTLVGTRVCRERARCACSCVWPQRDAALCLSLHGWSAGCPSSGCEAGWVPPAGSRGHLGHPVLPAGTHGHVTHTSSRSRIRADVRNPSRAIAPFPPHLNLSGARILATTTNLSWEWYQPRGRRSTERKKEGPRCPPGALTQCENISLYMDQFFPVLHFLPFATKTDKSDLSRRKLKTPTARSSSPLHFCISFCSLFLPESPVSVQKENVCYCQPYRNECFRRILSAVVLISKIRRPWWTWLTLTAYEQALKVTDAI